MKKRFILFLSSVLIATAATAQTADEIVGKYLKAIGGEEAWKKVSTLKASGSMNAQGTEISLSIVSAQEKGYRTDYTVMGMSGYSIITPKAGWYFNPGSGQTKAEPMTADQVNQGQDQLDLQGELINYQSKGHKVEYLGSDKLEGIDCYKLKVITKSGKEETMFIDKSNDYLIRTVTKVKVNGKEVESAVSFSNYQKQASGIVYPMTLGTDNGEIKLSKVEVNVPVEAKTFTPES
jgi:hypothetical protein